MLKFLERRQQRVARYPVWRVRWFEDQAGGDPEIDKKHAGDAKWYVIAWITALVGTILVLRAPGGVDVVVYLIVPAPALVWIVVMVEMEAERQGRRPWGMFAVAAQVWLLAGLALPQALRAMRSPSTGQGD